MLVLKMSRTKEHSVLYKGCSGLNRSLGPPEGNAMAQSLTSIVLGAGGKGRVAGCKSS